MTVPPINLYNIDSPLGVYVGLLDLIMRKTMKKPVESPCIHVCKLHDNVCIGCGRTAEELTEWMRMTNEQKLAAIENGKKRLEELF